MITLTTRLTGAWSLFSIILVNSIKIVTKGWATRWRLATVTTRQVLWIRRGWCPETIGRQLLPTWSGFVSGVFAPERETWQSGLNSIRWGKMFPHQSEGCRTKAERLATWVCANRGRSDSGRGRACRSRTAKRHTSSCLARELDMVWCYPVAQLSATESSVIMVLTSLPLRNMSTSVSSSLKNVKFSLAAIFLVYLVLVYTVYIHFPKLSEDERAKVKLPKNEQEVRQLASVLVKYRDNNYLVLFTAILLLYIFLQSFAIPGSIMLSVLSGCLFPIPVALFLICLVSK